MISAELAQTMTSVKAEIDSYFMTAYQEKSPLEKTGQAMAYMTTLGDGGKRIRPILAFLAHHLFAGQAENYLPFAVAVEEIHTYTLIIDDIQDGDDMRRNQPTCHTKFGPNTAYLAAARLFERGLAPFHAFDPDIRMLVRDLNDKLHQGQAADLEAENWDASQRTEESWRFIAAGKTGALLQLALLGGALAAGIRQKEKLMPLITYGYHLGLVFQARDDILGAVADQGTFGKKIGADDTRNKFTFYTLNKSDLQTADALMTTFVENGIKALEAYPQDRTKLLLEVMNFAAYRQK